MHKKISPVLFALLLAAGPAFGQFEGLLEMKMTMSGMGGEGGGTINVYVASAGFRSEMNMKMGPMDTKMVMLQKNDNPNTMYRINDASKTYTEVDLAKMKELAGQQEVNRKYTVEKLGQEPLLGYRTQHVLVKEQTSGGGTGMILEIWSAKDLMDYETFSKMQVRRGKGGSEEAMIKALKEADADGLPLKSLTTTPEGMKVSMEVVKVVKKSLPAATFEIPEGYTKSEGGLMDMMGGAQAGRAKKQMGDAQKQMEDALKNMTPEQREMMQKMMKQQKAGSQ